MRAIKETIAAKKMGGRNAGFATLRVFSGPMCRCRLRGSALMEFWKGVESLLPASQTFFLSWGFRRDLLQPTLRARGLGLPAVKQHRLAHSGRAVHCRIHAEEKFRKLLIACGVPLLKVRSDHRF